MADGESDLHNEPEDEAAKPNRKLISFAKTRTEDDDLKQMYADMHASVTPHPKVAVDDMLPPHVVVK